MKGDLQLCKFLIFSVLTIPSPTVYDGPPSPKVGEGFQCVDFIYKFDRFGEKQSVDFLPFLLARSFLKAG